jgi:sulfopyruvate decarboxylase subunit beta
MMRRDVCFRILARHITNQIVVATYQAAFEWLAAKPDHPLSYFSVGAMGQASSHALGLALGRPDKQVIVLDGDGSLLMNLGSLVTIAEARPKNLIHFVCENGNYEANGGHPIPGKDKLSFSGFAKSAGFPKVHEFTDLKDFEGRIGDVLKEEGPVFGDLKIVAGNPPAQDYGFIHGPGVREKFRANLKADRPR